MKLRLRSPVKLYIENPSEKELLELRAMLTYRDKKIQFEIQKLKKATWLRHKIGEEAFQERLEGLKRSEQVCLLNEDGDGYWVLSGLRQRLEKKFSVTTESLVHYPKGSPLPWKVVPAKEPRPYQVSIDEALLKARHARVSVATGLGKSFCLMLLARQLGLKTIIMAPSTSIADQLYKEFETHLGKKYVGAFYGSKKDYKKLIVIGNGQSLTRVDPESPVGQELSLAQVFIADESHQTPASTFERVCTGICAAAPYRFFFSATQIRNDGLDLLLDAITGPTVFEMSAKEGMDQGYLAQLHFKVVKFHTDKRFESEDANEMTREHLFYNPQVLKRAAAVANMSVAQHGHQVLILIDEVKQFTRLLPLLNHPVKFAHGPLGANKAEVPPAYQEGDPNDLVEAFNRCEFPILVGTSCISTGTDIRSVKTMIYLKGGKSEVEVKQGVGRCTRKHAETNKTACTVVDFDVDGAGVVHKHALARIRIYEEICPDSVELLEW